MRSQPVSVLDRLGLGRDGGLANDHAVMPEQEAENLARSIWRIDGKATRLATEKDDTFRLASWDDNQYVVKISNPSEARSSIDFEVELTRHVARSPYSVPVPDYIEASDGAFIVGIRDHAGQNRFARIMTYTPGTTLDATSSSPSEREWIGEILANLRFATSTFTHSADGRLCAWDVQHLPTLEPLLQEVDNHKHRKLLEAGFERFMQVAAGQLTGLRSQILHNDFSRSNLIVDHNNPKFINGVIDFGDAVRTGIAVDVSTALLNQLPRDAAERPVDDIFEGGRDVLRGYLRRADLTQAELLLLPHLVMGRVIGRALITLHRAKLVAGNTRYILRNTDQGWAQLSWFLGRTADEVSASLASTE